MKIYGIFDIGSNSIKAYLGKFDENQLITIYDKNHVTRLSENMNKTGILSNEAMQRSYECIEKSLTVFKDKQVNEIYAIGTMALRKAQNASVFINEIKSRFGIDILVLSGKEEATYSYAAILAGFPNSKDNRIVIDIGGGSTEFIHGLENEIISHFSIDIGAVALKEMYLNSEFINPIDWGRSYSYLLENLQGQITDYIPEDINNMSTFYGIGGTVTTLVSVKLALEKYNADFVHGHHLTKKDIIEQIDLFRSMPLEKRKQITGLHPKRADIIIAGATILLFIMNHLRKKEIIVSDWGIRQGYLWFHHRPHK